MSTMQLRKRPSWCKTLTYYNTAAAAIQATPCVPPGSSLPNALINITTHRQARNLRIGGIPSSYMRLKKMYIRLQSKTILGHRGNQISEDHQGPHLVVTGSEEQPQSSVMYHKNHAWSENKQTCIIICYQLYTACYLQSKLKLKVFLVWEPKRHARISWYEKIIELQSDAIIMTGLSVMRMESELHGHLKRRSAVVLDLTGAGPSSPYSKRCKQLVAGPTQSRPYMRSQTSQH